MQMDRFLGLKRRRGAAMLVNMIIVALMMGVMATSFVHLSSAQLSSMDAYRTAFQAQQLCESKANEIGVVSYGMLSSEGRAVVPGATDWQREVILGTETNLGGNNYQREVVINVYYGSESIPRATVKKFPTIAGQIVAPGTIAIWKGAASAIPYGWLLCDGANGTPDLRSRFVYGAGGDSNTKSEYVSGWNNVNGHLAVGTAGGEETHRLLIAEMPNHSHTYQRHIVYSEQVPRDNADINYMASPSLSSYETSSVGGNQPHNIMPRFFALCYIMKK